MKLYGSYTSPFVRHCRIAILEAGLETEQLCEFVETDAAASAKLSPTQRVPYLEDGELKLSDSSSIIKYLRNRAGDDFLPQIEDYDLFCLVNTLLDTAINLFFLEKDALTPADSQYLQRQQQRIHSGLEELNALTLPMQTPYKDSELRLACFLDWALFRERISLNGFGKLEEFLKQVKSYPAFSKTSPPQ